MVDQHRLRDDNIFGRINVDLPSETHYTCKIWIGHVDSEKGYRRG